MASRRRPNWGGNTEVVRGNTKVVRGNTEVVRGNTEVVRGPHGHQRLFVDGIHLEGGLH